MLWSSSHIAALLYVMAVAAARDGVFQNRAPRPTSLDKNSPGTQGKISKIKTPKAQPVKKDSLIFYPQDQPASAGKKNQPTPARKVPLHLPNSIDQLSYQDLQMVNKIGTMSEFATLFGLEMPKPTPGVSIRVGVPGAATTIPAEMANCAPELRTVELRLPASPGVTYYPTCTRLMRCGGCCYGSLLECQPTETQAVTLQILSTTVTPSRSVTPRERRAVPTYLLIEEEQHTACSCLCKQKADDCLSVQEYVDQDCACVCKDKVKLSQCQEKISTHFWHKETCSCVCRRTQECSSGDYFDHDDCSCRSSSRSG